MDKLLINGVKAMIRETMGGTCLSSTEGIATLRTLCQEVECPFHDKLCITICCTALAVLWMALHKGKFPLLATLLQAAAGVTGSQRWFSPNLLECPVILDPSVSLFFPAFPVGLLMFCNQTIQNLTAPSDMHNLGLPPLARPCPLIG